MSSGIMQAPIDDIGDASAAPLDLDFSTLLEQEWFASFLILQVPAVQDALALGSTCRTLNILRVLPRQPLESTKSWRNPSSQYSPHLWQTIEPLDGLRVHSVLLDCKWRDQGWGNRKGMISVVKNEGKAPNDYTKWSEDVVCGKEPAPHESTMLQLSFRPGGGDSQQQQQQPRDVYKIYARAGGGGGHALTVSDLNVRELALVDCDRARERFDEVSRERLTHQVTSTSVDEPGIEFDDDSESDVDSQSSNFLGYGSDN